MWVWHGRGVGVAWAWRGCVCVGPNSVLWGQEQFQCDMQGANSGPLSRNIIPLAAIPPLHCCHAYFYLIWSHYAPTSCPCMLLCTNSWVRLFRGANSITLGVEKPYCSCPVQKPYSRFPQVELFVVSIQWPTTRSSCVVAQRMTESRVDTQQESHGWDFH